MRFSTGDTVIVSEDVNQCVFGAAEEMIEMIGKEVQITDIGYSAYMRQGYYKIAQDDSRYKWTDNCFMTVDEWNVSQNITVTDDEFSEVMSFLFDNPSK